MNKKKLVDSEEKHVGVWIRVSTEQQAQGESPEHHEHRARAYADFKGWKVARVYHLEGVSGKSVMEHPEARKMLDDVRTGRISGLIFSKLARLARSTKELLEFADFFKEHGADLISLGESIDTSTPAGLMFYTMIAAMGQWEREEIASRVAASIPIRAKLGKPLSGNSPFGYKWESNRLTLDPTEAPIRKLMYELFEQSGYRVKTVARTLNEKGYRTRKGMAFTDTSVKRLLLDPTAKGIRRANYTTHRNGRPELKPESEWVYVPVESIVSTDLWDRCAAHLAPKGPKPKPRTKRPVHLFAGLLFCSCGQKMYVPSKTTCYTCKDCRNKVNPAAIEAVFVEQIKQFYLSEKDVAQHLEEADEVLNQKTELLVTLKAERERLVSEMQKTHKLYLNDRLSPDAFAKLYSPMEERARQLDEEIPYLEGETDFLKMKILSREEIVSDARDLYTRFPELPLEHKRSIVEHITERITASETDLTIDLCYLPNSYSELAAKGQPSPTAWSPC